MTVYALIGAVVFLALGVIEYALLNRVLYPALRWRYEKAKVTQSQGVAPARIMTLLKIQSFILMPPASCSATA